MADEAIGNSIAVCAPSGADALTIVQVLDAVDLRARVLGTLEQFGDYLLNGGSSTCAGLMVAEEALVDDTSLVEALERQPIWSDLPVTILTVAGHRASSRRRWELFRSLGNVTLLARPLRREDLQSAARAMARIRARQYQTRTHLIELEAASRFLEQRVAERTKELQAVEATLRQLQKMEAIGQLTGGLAHDFNNLLQVIGSSVEMIKLKVKQGRSTELERYVQNIASAKDRAAALTHRLLAFSRRQILDPKPVDVNRLVLDMLDLVRSTVGPSVNVETRLHPEPVHCLCDPPQLENALLNLCINARDAMPAGGHLVIETSQVVLDADEAKRYGLAPGSYISSAVIDDGEGMASDVAERAFDPFFTTKPMDQGTGLGLSMVYGFARQSQGHTSIETVVGKGTTVRIWLPELEARVSAVEHPVTHEGETLLVVRKRILLVDDEANVRALIAEILQNVGHDVVEASDGVRGLEILQSDAVVDLVISDVGMPRMNGLEMIAKARAKRPELDVIFITGYSQTPVLSEGEPDARLQVMTKPFLMDALLERIETTLTR
ncbi:response regulator [Caballeronia sp. LZ001]|uniref:response regulator n=1 Tax=Caballeronia sp. LZ001 TaxID=3038553 RepID=UPI0028574380|nr:response regulator [Caballeronia sp. LZ001]MDR5806456.1 response regulator [Caballeronia sp. LZ001]